MPVFFYSKSWRLGAGRSSTCRVQTRVPQVPQTIHQLRGRAMPRETTGYVATTRPVTLYLTGNILNILSLETFLLFHSNKVRLMLARLSTS